MLCVQTIIFHNSTLGFNFLCITFMLMHSSTEKVMMHGYSHDGNALLYFQGF